ncbi:MAG: hypothetical protein JF588_08515 [Caulobacterales bacterium]|nr:hypothetical protein [Caulobacterales bacterium]
MSGKPLAAALMAAAALGACAKTASAPASNGSICANFKLANAGVAPGAPEGAATVDECVRRWAYSLATSRDPAESVAEAATVACSTALVRWNQAAVAQPDGADESASLITGQPTNPLAEHNAFAHSRALLYVVQARAGNCPAPPAKDGRPEGVVG